MDNNMDNLRWVRAFSADVIPRYLVEQIKKKDYSVDDFYKYQDNICLRDTKEGPTLNPFSHLHVLADKNNMTKGFTWFCIDPLTKDIVIQIYSVDKEYWAGGNSVKKLSDHIKDIRKKGNLNKVYWIHSYPRHTIKHGFKISKDVLCEYDWRDEEKKSQKVDKVCEKTSDKE